jgi:prophage regulatory protein
MIDRPTLLRRPDVRARTGLSDTRIDELERRGAFPRRVQISQRAVGWVDSEITDYIRARIAARDAHQPQQAA